MKIMPLEQRGISTSRLVLGCMPFGVDWDRSPITKEHVRSAEMALAKETTREAIVLGWLMKHPAMIQPVIGTANAERIIACKDAEEQSKLMTREEWYSLYVCSRGKSMP